MCVFLTLFCINLLTKGDISMFLTKVVPSVSNWQVALTRSYSCQSWSNLQSIFRRFYSSQLPTSKESGWQGFAYNAKKFQMQPPLSPAEVAHGKNIVEVKKACERMERKFEDVVASNQELRGDIQRFNKLPRGKPRGIESKIVATDQYPLYCLDS